MAPTPPDINVVPSWCKGLAPLTLTSEGPGANQIAVISYPFVKFTDDQVTSLLANIYGGGAGGPGLIAGIAQATQATPPVIPTTPFFVASGWVRDATADQKATRGTIWLAFGWKSPVTAQNVIRFANMVMKAASVSAAYPAGVDPTVGHDGVYNTTLATGKPIGPGAVPKIAASQSDTDLQNAAIASAAATMQGMMLLGFLFTLGGGPLSTLSTRMPSTTALLHGAGQVRLAATAAQQIGTLLPQVPAVAVATAAASQENCQAAVTAAQSLAAQLQAARTQLLAGIASAPGIAQLAQVEAQPGGGAITEQIRDQVKAMVDGLASGPTTNYLISKQYMQCTYYNQAQASLQRQINDVSHAFADIAGIAAAVIANDAVFRQAIAGVDAALAVLDAAEQQSCLAWYMKKWMGAPKIVWIGGVAVVGLGAFVFAVRRKKMRAKAAAAPKTVTANRRRSRRRSS
jgi:hypothetical protein